MIPRRRIAAGLVLLAAGTAVWLGFLRGDQNQADLTASGTVEATEAELGFAAGGRIVEIRVHEGDSVQPGDTLALLDLEEMRARREQMNAQVSFAKAQLLELERGTRAEEVTQSRAADAAAQQKLEDAEKDLQRSRRLAEGGAISEQALEKAKVAYDLAKSAYEQARAELDLREKGPRFERISAQRAQVAIAEAQVLATDAALNNMTIRATFPGRVTVRHRELGEAVTPGAAVLTVMNPDDRWVRIYIPENRVGAVQLGEKARISSDTYQNKSYSGEVVHIAEQAEFTPRNVQTAEERVKLVYAVKVRITGDPAFELKPGMPADVLLEAGAE